MKLQSATPVLPKPTRPPLAFAGAINAGELDRASACFARDGCLITPDGTAIHGREPIRDLLAQMILRRTEIEVEMASAIDAGEVVLSSQRWTIRSGEAPMRRLTQTTTAIIVLRLVEGTWKLSLLAPWGCRHLHP